MSDAVAGKVKELALQVGYEVCGITSADPFDQFARALADRVQRFPEAAALYESLSGRSDPRKTRPWAQSIVVCVRWYGKFYVEGSLPPGIGRCYLFDRRHATCPDADMPRNMKAGLRALGMRVARGGVPERWAAARSGVASFGRNNFVYAGSMGSLINVESFVVDAPLTPDAPSTDCPCPDNCRACIKACPTGALESPYCMRYDRCIAHLTYGSSQPVAADLWEKMGEWVYGCDRCQDVCPLNAKAVQPLVRAHWIEPLLPLLQPSALASMDDRTLREVVHPLFWYIPEQDLDRWRRNARRAMALSGEGGV